MCLVTRVTRVCRGSLTCDAENPTSATRTSISKKEKHHVLLSSFRLRALAALSMGHKADQNTFPTTYRPNEHPSQIGEELAPPPQGSVPPHLPPRSDSTTLDTPPPYTEIAPTYHSQPLSHSWSSQDPRSSSTQSLVPHQSTDGNGKRTLLLVCIHGFMGNETSFQSFPAHIHNIVTVKLVESHVVHTKIYPKYKSRKHIEFARDGLSEWLRPHEGPDTDVILLGHSMGGILSAEVALLKRHRILGTINFDTPFVGMHPGVIASGLGSLFKPAPGSPASTPVDAGKGSQGQDRMRASGGTETPAGSSHLGSESGSTPRLMPTDSITTLPESSSSTLTHPAKDTNYDPPFTNDIRLPQRTGWANALHFINKHSDGLTKATQAYVKSHLEFGGAMADYKGLKSRYDNLRALEDLNASDPARVRFVNYYTASTGRPKKVKSGPASRVQTGGLDDGTVEVEHRMQGTSLEELNMRSPTRSPRISVEGPDSEVDTGGGFEATDRDLSAPDRHTIDEAAMSATNQAMKRMAKAPDPDNEEEVMNKIEPATLQSTTSATTSPSDLSKPSSVDGASSLEDPALPPLPAAPEEPPAFDPMLYQDKDARKLAEKEHAREVKAYQQAVKDRDKTINDRRKFLEKREKTAVKEREKQLKAEEKEKMKGMEKGEKERAKEERGVAKRAEKERAKEEKLEQKRLEKERLNAEKEARKEAKKSDVPSLIKTDSEASKMDGEESNPKKPKRDKKFCMLPRQVNGKADPCWVRVYMPGVDEVGAHCGLFFVDGERYSVFVRDVAERIQGWIDENIQIERTRS